MKDSTHSFPKAAWKRLQKNKAAILGLVLIAMAVLLCITGYFIAPDHSPNANRIILEIGARKPGFGMHFLKLKKEKPVERAGFLSHLLNGQEDLYNYMPVESWKMEGDSVQVDKYIDEGLTEKMFFLLSKTAHADHEDPVVHKTFWLGTDKYGRDILSRLIIGVRVSLSVGLIAVIISLTIGLLLGAVAGYFGGRTDDMVMWLINVVWSIPTLLLVFAITLVLGKGFWQVFIAVGLTMWVNVARVIRGQVLGIRELEYVEAAKALGFTHGRIIIRHILPNVLGPVMVIAASNFATAIVVEAGLSFLGVGVQPPQPSWGLMIKENYNFIITHNPLIAIAPGVCIMVLVLAFNLLGNALRDACDVESRR